MFSSRADPERQSLLRRHAAPDANRTLKNFIFGGVAATVILGAALAFLGTDGSFLRASELGASGVPARLGTGTKPITYTVHLCGVPEDVWNRHVPWPVCRVKLVGCPNGAACWHWRYHQGIEMSPVDDSRNAFTITTSEFGPGDTFGFAVVEAGCTVEDERECVGPELDQPARCKRLDLCDHRYDSGTFDPLALTSDPNYDGHNITCWNGDTRCSSSSPFAFLPYEKRTCIGAPGGPWFNRVLTRAHVKAGEYSAVWGSCASEPEGAYAKICMNTAGVQSLCPLLERPIVERDEPEVEPCAGKVDGTVAVLVHPTPGSDDVEIKATCCGGNACPENQMCLTNGQCGRAEPQRSTAVCVSGEAFPSTGVCTQSCGTGNDHCDKTCEDAAASTPDAELDCVIGGKGKNACRCSNVSGGTKDECPFFPNPGWKCCTCQSLKLLGASSPLRGGGPRNVPPTNASPPRGR